VRAARDFQAHRIDKYEFYQRTRWYSVAKVSAATGVPQHVVRLRRRDLRRMRMPS
jgi:hypothetical protein